MGNTSIEWTDKSWNPIRGCSVVSEGCRNCYAMQVAARFSGDDPKTGKPLAYKGLAYRNESGAHWTGEVRLIEEHLDDPLRWRKPARIFVNSMSDLFHESIPDEWIHKIFQVMYDAKQHVFQVLTKRPERMLRVISNSVYLTNAPLENVWLGVSIEDQETADKRLPLLLHTPAAVRWVSAEPLLGPINLERWLCSCPVKCEMDSGSIPCSSDGYLDWLVVGGESGPRARPMNPAWASSLRDQCVAAGVPFFFKQWGAWGETATLGFGDSPRAETHVFETGESIKTFGGSVPFGIEMRRVGKKEAGRMLDGRTWDQLPTLSA